jgi:hypothetical protein
VAVQDVQLPPGFSRLQGVPPGSQLAQRYRERPWDNRAGTNDLNIPKLREVSYLPDWLLEPRPRTERALVAVIAECYVRGVSTRRFDGLIKTLGIEGRSKSQVSALAKNLDPITEGFRSRPLDGAPYVYVTLDALTWRATGHRWASNSSARPAPAGRSTPSRRLLSLSISVSSTPTPRHPIITRRCASWRHRMNELRDQSTSTSSRPLGLRHRRVGAAVTSR